MRLSDDPSVIANPVEVAQVDPQNPRTWTLKAIPGIQAGHATITVHATDIDTNETETSFAVQVINDSGGNTPPSFPPFDGTNNATWKEQRSGTSVDYSYKATDSETANDHLLITAISSNSSLVPNDSAHLSCGQPGSSGTGTLTITPIVPSSGGPQSATITLSVSDNAFVRRMQFLYVYRPQTATTPVFLRPYGVYNLDPDQPDDHRTLAQDPFLTGEMRRISWRLLEPLPPSGSIDHFNWQPLDQALADLPDDLEVLSLNLVEEPCYIGAQNPNLANIYCDTARTDWGCLASLACSVGARRAAPWDGYLQARRDNFLSNLAQHLGANLSKISVINPNLPGADTGIQDGSVPLSQLPNYTRENLLQAVQHELRSIQHYFPGKLIQFGFFVTYDGSDDDPNYGNTKLWQWLYRDAYLTNDANGLPLLPLADEFNGIKRPRVSFFQEDLAASRVSAAPDFIPLNDPPNTLAYTTYPDMCSVPTFAYGCNFEDRDCKLPTCTPDNTSYNNGIVFQANTPWSSPADPSGSESNKVTKTLNGTPNDGIEGAFNTFYSQYFEVYLGDLDHAKPVSGEAPWDARRWRAGLTSWHDYTAYLQTQIPLEPPAGLSVTRNAANNNTVTWFHVYSPTTTPVSYTLQHRSFTANSGWTTVNCSDPHSNSCTDSGWNGGTEYAYKVIASNGGQNPDSAPASVAVFVSEAANDGYIANDGVTPRQTFPNGAVDGIRVGEATTSNPIFHVRGILSFKTSYLNGRPVVGGQLSLKQSSENTNFDPNNPCQVDIENGSFDEDQSLQGDDYDWSNAFTTKLDAFSITAVGKNASFQADLTAFLTSINNSNDYTQFRLHRNDGNLPGNYVGWYSGNSAGNEPLLIVRYK